MKVLKALSAVLFFLSAFVCLPVILVVLTVDVTLRFGFNAPIPWAQELATILLFLSMALAMPHAWLMHAHVKADFLQELISKSLQEVFVRLKWMLVLALSATFVWQCWRDAQFMLMINESTPELFVPLAYLRGVLALAAALSGCIALLKLFSLRRLGKELEQTNP